MKIETLKQLILNLSGGDHCSKQQVLTLIDLFEIDQEDLLQFPDYPELRPTIYADICSCNPRNGGSGVCGCTMANQPINKIWTSTITTTNYTTDVKTETSGNS